MNWGGRALRGVEVNAVSRELQVDLRQLVRDTGHLGEGPVCERSAVRSQAGALVEVLRLLPENATSLVFTIECVK